MDSSTLHPCSATVMRSSEVKIFRIITPLDVALKFATDLDSRGETVATVIVIIDDETGRDFRRDFLARTFNAFLPPSMSLNTPERASACYLARKLVQIIILLINLNNQNVKIHCQGTKFDTQYIAQNVDNGLWHIEVRKYRMTVGQFLLNGIFDCRVSAFAGCIFEISHVIVKLDDEIINAFWSGWRFCAGDDDEGITEQN